MMPSFGYQSGGGGHHDHDHLLHHCHENIMIQRQMEEYQRLSARNQRSEPSYETPTTRMTHDNDGLCCTTMDGISMTRQEEGEDFYSRESIGAVRDDPCWDYYDQSFIAAQKAAMDSYAQRHCQNNSICNEKKNKQDQQHDPAQEQPEDDDDNNNSENIVIAVMTDPEDEDYEYVYEYVDEEEEETVSDGAGAERKETDGEYEEVVEWYTDEEFIEEIQATSSSNHENEQERARRKAEDEANRLILDEYEAVLQLSETGGNVKQEQWAMQAPLHISALKRFRFCGTGSCADGTQRHGDETSCKCLICQSPYEHNDELRRLPCGHCFHVNCVDQWLSAKDSCPYCRQSIVCTEITSAWEPTL